MLNWKSEIVAFVVIWTCVFRDEKQQTELVEGNVISFPLCTQILGRDRVKVDNGVFGNRECFRSAMVEITAIT